MRLSETVEMILVLGSLFLYILTTVWLGRRILKPMDVAAERTESPTQFMMTDFLSLMFQLQLPLAMFSGVRDWEGGAVLICGLLCMAVLLTWWGGIRTVSRAGIRDPKRRGLFVALILPVTFVCSLTALPLAGTVCYAIATREDAPWWVFLLSVLVPLLLFACKRAVDWVLSENLELKAK